MGSSENSTYNAEIDILEQYATDTNSNLEDMDWKQAMLQQYENDSKVTQAVQETSNTPIDDLANKLKEFINPLTKVKNNRFYTEVGGIPEFDFKRACNKGMNRRVNVIPRSYSDCFADEYSSIQSDNSLGYPHFIILKYLDSIPSIRIKQYQPDIPIDQWISIFKSSYDYFNQEMEGKGLTEISKQVQDQFLKIVDSLVDGSFIKKLITNMNGNSLTTINKGTSGSNKDINLYDFPEIIYRQLMSYQVIARFHLPYSGKIKFENNGNDGWNVNSLSDKFGFLQRFGSVNINTRPTWKLSKSNGDQIQYDLILVNDTKEDAINNYIFVHTIIPNNMWMQYGVLQQSPALYDVKFSGGLRYFCCSLNIACENIGVTRRMKYNGFTKIKANNITVPFIFYIPDCYKISFIFQSLLPNNFNTYLMTYNEVDSIIYGTDSGIDTDNQGSDGSSISKSEVAGRFDTVYKNMGQKIMDTIKEVAGTSGSSPSSGTSSSQENQADTTGETTQDPTPINEPTTSQEEANASVEKILEAQKTLDNTEYLQVKQKNDTVDSMQTAPYSEYDSKLPWVK